MSFQMTMLMISFIVTFILALIIIPILKKIKVGQIEREDGPQSHLKKQGTPTMGGIIFMIAIILCVTGVYLYLHFIRKGRYSTKFTADALLNNGVWNNRFCR